MSWSQILGQACQRDCILDLGSDSDANSFNNNENEASVTTEPSLLGFSPEFHHKSKN